VGRAAGEETLVAEGRRLAATEGCPAGAAGCAKGDEVGGPASA